MSEETRLYEGVPFGAVFEACQMALRELKISIMEENKAERRIFAKTGLTMKSFGQTIVLKMEEVGQATELKLDISSGQASDWGEGKKLMDGLIYQVEREIQKIRDAGRIAPVEPVKYGFGETTPSPPPVDQRSPSAHPVETKSSGGNWPLRILIAGGMFWLLFTSSGADFASSILKSFTVETDIAKYDCDKAASLVKGESLQNAFGAQFKVLEVSSLSQVSKSADRIVCSGAVDLSNGRSQRMRITVEKGSNSSEIRYRIEPM